MPLKQVPCSVTIQSRWSLIILIICGTSYCLLILMALCQLDLGSSTLICMPEGRRFILPKYTDYYICKVPRSPVILGHVMIFLSKE